MTAYQVVLGVAVGWLGADLVQAYRGRLRTASFSIGYVILVVAWGMVVYANSH